MGVRPGMDSTASSAMKATTSGAPAARIAEMGRWGSMQQRNWTGWRGWGIAGDAKSFITADVHFLRALGLALGCLSEPARASWHITEPEAKPRGLVHTNTPRRDGTGPVQGSRGGLPLGSWNYLCFHR